MHTVYADGGQNPSFSKAYLPEVSRPDALAQGPVDQLLDEKSKKFSPVAQQTAAATKPKATTRGEMRIALIVVGYPTRVAAFVRNCYG